MRRHLLRSSCAAFVVAGLPAQIDTITEARVREAVSWLADDARAGRASPSPGLEEAAGWLGKRFAAAGLKQVVENSWYHDYTVPGVLHSAKDATLTLERGQGADKKTFVLAPGTDVRLWRGGDATSGEGEACTVALAGDPVLRQMLRVDAARRPTVIEIAEDHPYWKQAAEDRTLAGSVRGASRPVFLVRTGLLPPAAGKESSWTATWKAPAAAKVDVTLHNVVALLPGTDKQDEYVVVSAHYDHIGVGEGTGGDTIYNGADDDATGTTAVLLLAEALAKEPAPRRSVLFVCFSAEEIGLRGSRAFVEKPPVPLDHIVVDVNLEMIGRPEEGKAGKAWITGSDLSDFASICTEALGKQGVGVVDFGMAGMLFAQSDNYSFAQRGIVAHSLSAGSLHADYHQPTDEVSRLDLPHMTRIVRGLHDVVRAFADREAKPAWTEAGKQRIERMQQRRK